MRIVDKIKNIPGLCHLAGCTEYQIQAAESSLNLVFPEEFREYVKAYGAISFGSTEWKGLGVEGWLNVVEATMEERKFSDDFPADCFVLENLAIDGILIIVNAKGEVYSYVSGNKPSLISNSVSEYLDMCIEQEG